MSDDLDTIITEHEHCKWTDSLGFSWCGACPNTRWPCLPYQLAVRARDAEQKVAAVRSVHARYFDLDEHPGGGDSCPEPEDVWRFDRDFRAAMGGDHD